MSFVGEKERVEAGDTVILFLSVNSIYALEVKDKIANKHGNMVENVFQSMYGALTVMDLVGKRYGSKIALSKGYAWLLHPTCELWTKTVTHRTQIIYTPDISLITFGLDLVPGSTVIEAGTGTGSLSHALIRCVVPVGHLYTFDFHEQRAQLAREEFQKHGLSEWVTVGHRDVISDGFNVDKLVDAIFLDLPSPWEVVPHVRRSLKRGGRLCTFSPCIEQVQKTCEALKATGAFIMIRTQEVLQRPLTISNKMLPSLDLFPEPQPASSLPENETEGQAIKESKHLTPVKRDQIKFRSIYPPATTPGHTGYLTFTTMVGSPITKEQELTDMQELKKKGRVEQPEEMDLETPILVTEIVKS